MFETNPSDRSKYLDIAKDWFLEEPSDKLLMADDEKEAWLDYISKADKPLSKRFSKIHIIKKTQAKMEIESSKISQSLSGIIKNDKSSPSLRKKAFAIEAHLDLHGLTKSNAKSALLAFINRSLQENYKNLLVITGKGIKSDGTIGVIRQNIANWLSDDNLSDKVGAFCQARNKDGGQGAIYVRLKKKK